MLLKYTQTTSSLCEAVTPVTVDHPSCQCWPILLPGPGAVRRGGGGRGLRVQGSGFNFAGSGLVAMCNDIRLRTLHPECRYKQPLCLGDNFETKV